MLEIKDVVNVIINRESSSKSIQDLQTIAILSNHSVYGVGEAYREYGSTTEMLSDGFITDDFAYIAAQRIFSQEPQVRSIIVGMMTQPIPALLEVFAVGNNTYVEEIVKLQSANSNWFFLITDATLPEDKLAIAEYIETQTAVYVFSDNGFNVTDTLSADDSFSLIGSKGLIKSIGMYTKNQDLVAPEAAWVGRFASATIGSNTWIHKALATLAPEEFSRTEIAVLKSKNAHFYTKVGQDPSIEGNANTLGGEKIHVILGAIWLEVRLSERVWNVLYSKERLNYTNSSIEIFRAEIVGVLNEAVYLNILTDEDGFNISVPDTNKLTSQERASGYLRKIKFRARLAGAILFVDAIEGTVYA